MCMCVCVLQPDQYVSEWAAGSPDLESTVAKVEELERVRVYTHTHTRMHAHTHTHTHSPSSLY